VLCAAMEASGDALLAHLLPPLRALHPEARWVGMGGQLSAAAGLEVVVDPRPLAAHGLTEALSALPATLRALRALRALAGESRALLLVDAPEVNTRLLRHAVALGRPVAYLAPPQAWAWRPGRAALLREARWLGCLFGFEAEWYQARGGRAVEVGHPLRLAPPPRLDPTAGHLLICPGSRPSAARRALPLSLAALAALNARRAHRGEAPLRGVLALSGWLEGAEAEARGLAARLGVPLEVRAGLPAAMEGARLALCHAGTATLELGLAGLPFVAMAPLSPLSAAVARRLVRAPHYALPNLILGARVCEELPPRPLTPLHAAAALERLLSCEAWRQTHAALLALPERVLSPQAPEVAAQISRALGL
jgi:lipid-A-disaccharide synthase